MDMWALGVSVYLWIFGSLPFVGVAPFVIYENIRSKDVKVGGCWIWFVSGGEESCCFGDGDEGTHVTKLFGDAAPTQAFAWQF